MNISNNFQLSASDAISCNVKTARDESVGSIKDIIVNASTFEIDYVVLKVDEGFLNLGSKLLALPAESFNFHPHQDDVIIVKETKETLENAPGFDSDQWPTSPQGEFLHTVRSYYSAEDRSLHGRYDLEKRAYYDEINSLDESPGRIRDEKYGDGFLETDHRGGRQSEMRRGGDPLL